MTPNPRDPTQRGGMGGGRGMVPLKENISCFMMFHLMHLKEDMVAALGCKEVVVMAGGGEVTRYTLQILKNSTEFLA